MSASGPSSSTTSGPRVASGCGAGARPTTWSCSALRPTGPRPSRGAAGGRSCSPGSRPPSGAKGDWLSGLPRPVRPTRSPRLADRRACPASRLVGRHHRECLPRRPRIAGDRRFRTTARQTAGGGSRGPSARRPSPAPDAPADGHAGGPTPGPGPTLRAWIEPAVERAARGEARPDGLGRSQATASDVPEIPSPRSSASAS